MPEYPQEGAMRGGHIPGAKSVPWARAANPDGTFKPASELRAIYEQEQGLSPTDDVIAYCRIGERSSHTWFVLRYLLGYEQRSQLRRQLDRVGKRRPRADRAIRRITHDRQHPNASTAPAAAVDEPVITRTEVTWRGDRLFDAGPAGRHASHRRERQGSARSGRDAAQRDRDVLRASTSSTSSPSGKRPWSA